jgi:hypothetical protein
MVAEKAGKGDDGNSMDSPNVLAMTHGSQCPQYPGDATVEGREGCERRCASAEFLSDRSPRLVGRTLQLTGILTSFSVFAVEGFLPLEAGQGTVGSMQYDCTH